MTNYSKTLFYFCLSMFSTYAVAQKTSVFTEVVVLNNEQCLAIEATLNEKIRKSGERGFLELESDILRLSRNYKVEVNSGALVIRLNSNFKKVNKVIGHYTFSGSDIDATQDTLIVSVYFFTKNLEGIKTQLDKLTIHQKNNQHIVLDTTSKFVPFEISLDKVEALENDEYLVIQFLIKSGSDDSFYYGNSTAAFSELKLIGPSN